MTIPNDLRTLFVLSTPTSIPRFIPYYYYNNKFKSKRGNRSAKKEGKEFLIDKNGVKDG